jgi:tRNA G10  N-methylase Trm11
MGFPEKLKGPAAVFPRAYRFLFIPFKNAEIKSFVQNLSIDFIKKEIKISVMELAPDLDAQKWVFQIINENYTDEYKLIALDGCGHELYSSKFKDAKAIGHEVRYDYSSSDVVSHNVTLKYETMEKVEETSSRNENHWLSRRSQSKQ